MSTSLPRIRDIYAGHSVFVTGATGFIGRILVEKLLYSLPIKNIFVLIRDSKRHSAEERWAEITESLLFQRIRRECKEVINKVVLVYGDITQTNLGLSDADLERVCNECSFVFHVAATIKFDDALKNSVELNVRGTDRVISLCHRMPKLECFLHCSTAYANCEMGRVEEKVYPSPYDAHKLIDTVEWLNDDVLEAMTPKILGAKYNTYCLTKAIAETMVAENGPSLPSVIIRPSIVSGVWRDGVPGWAHGIQGLSAYGYAVAMGALTKVPGDLDNVIDAVPVDVVTNMMIVSSAWRSTQKDSKEVPVMTASTGVLNPGTLGMFNDLANKASNTRYEPAIITRNKIWLMENVFGSVMDGLRTLQGKKPFWRRQLARISELYHAVEQFISREFCFDNESIPRLVDVMQEEDRRDFNFDVREMDIDDHVANCAAGLKRFIFKEDLFDEKKMDAARERVQKFIMLNYAIVVFWCWIASIFITGSASPTWIFVLLSLVGVVYTAIEQRPVAGLVHKSVEEYRKEQEQYEEKPAESRERDSSDSDAKTEGGEF